MKLGTHVYAMVSMTTAPTNNNLRYIVIFLHSSNLLTVARMEVKLGVYVYLIVSMTTKYKNEWRQVNKKILWITKRRAYGDGIKRKEDKIGMENEA